jgi:hypothetical protein
MQFDGIWISWLSGLLQASKFENGVSYAKRYHLELELRKSYMKNRSFMVSYTLVM